MWRFISGDLASGKSRITDLLQKAQLNTNIKGVIIEFLKDAPKPLKQKLFELNLQCANGIEYNDLIEAITEQLTLIEE